jgi:regulatory protein
MKITSVEPQKKNPKRFNIFLNGQFAFGADEDLVVNRRLVVGKEVEKGDMEKILFEAEVGKLMEKMYGLFGIRQRSEKEVRDYLKRKNFEAKFKGKDEISGFTIDETVNTLKRKGLIDDKAFAIAWVESRKKKKGLKVIKIELFQKGIDREIIEEVLENQQGGEDTAARAALEKKINSWKSLPKQDQKRKAIDFLLRRGFEYSLVKELVSELIGRIEEESL